jgi:predicted esterase
MTFHSLEVRSDIDAAYVGPPLSAGPLPALFYFSLNAKESLCLDPFNQPVAYLSALPMRIFSLTLPGHENGLPPTEALNLWYSEIAAGKNPIAEFIEKIQFTVKHLENQGALLEGRTAVAGLSRGAFIATHAAAVIPQFQWVLGFAPLTKLSFAKEFASIAHEPKLKAFDLTELVGKLKSRKLRFYIGNLDARVSTRLCFDFIEKLSQAAFEQGIRSPSVQLIINPSIGKDGHGTSKEVFHEGAQWLAEELGAIHVL